MHYQPNDVMSISGNESTSLNSMSCIEFNDFAGRVGQGENFEIN
jgi:hypothetical protein